MAQPKLCRMSFTRRGIALVYGALKKEHDAIMEQARNGPAGDRVSHALHAAEYAELMERIVKTIQADGGLANVSNDPRPLLNEPKPKRRRNAR